MVGPLIVFVPCGGLSDTEEKGKTKDTETMTMTLMTMISYAESTF